MGNLARGLLITAVLVGFWLIVGPGAAWADEIGKKEFPFYQNQPVEKMANPPKKQAAPVHPSQAPAAVTPAPQGPAKMANPPKNQAAPALGAPQAVAPPVPPATKAAPSPPKAEKAKEPPQRRPGT